MISLGYNRRARLKTLEQYAFIDIHYHAAPDLYFRRLSALDAGRSYKACDGAVILKSHLGATSAQASLAQAEGLPVLPSVVLNDIAGGINYRVILRALAEYQPILNGKMLVDFPTLTGRKIQSKLERKFANEKISNQLLAPVTVFTNDRQLKPEVIDILKLANDYPIVLTTGHASKQEVYALIDACIQYNVSRLLLNQPANPLTNLNASELREIAQNDFVWIEQTFLTFALGHQTKDDFCEVLKYLPRVIYSSDLGQTSQIDIRAWLNYTNTLFSDFKLPLERQKELICFNPVSLLR